MVVYRLKVVRREPDGEWWLAMASRTLPQMRRAFARRAVGGILYETVVGEPVPTGTTYGGLPVVKIRLRIPKDRTERAGMELCLGEIGIGLLDPVENAVPTQY